MFTKQRVLFILEAGADCVAMAEPSKLSCIESKAVVDAIFCAKMDPAVGVWLLDKYLADLWTQNKEYTKLQIINFFGWERKAN